MMLTDPEEKEGKMLKSRLSPVLGLVIQKIYYTLLSNNSNALHYLLPRGSN